METFNKIRPAKGEWPNIEKFLRNLFGTEEDYLWGVDYIKALYLGTFDKLPVVCLVSKDHGTGKTTFLNLLQIICGDRMTIDDCWCFSRDHNDCWADKSCLAIDNGDIFGNLDEAIDVIKHIIKDNVIVKKTKHERDVVVLNKINLIIYSNDPDVINNLSDINCKVFTPHRPDNMDYGLFDKLIEELRYFLYDLESAFKTEYFQKLNVDYGYDGYLKRHGESDWRENVIEVFEITTKKPRRVVILPCHGYDMYYLRHVQIENCKKPPEGRLIFDGEMSVNGKSYKLQRNPLFV